MSYCYQSRNVLFWAKGGEGAAYRGTRLLGWREPSRRKQEADDPWIRTVIRVQVVREGRIGAAEWVKRNQNGFGIVFEALRRYPLESCGHFAKLPAIGRSGFSLSQLHQVNFF